MEALTTASPPMVEAGGQTIRSSGMSTVTGVASTFATKRDPHSHGTVADAATVTLLRQNGSTTPLTFDQNQRNYAASDNTVTRRPYGTWLEVQEQGQTATVARARVEWQGDATNYLALGSWLTVNNTTNESEMGAFVDGPLAENIAATLPVMGTATYTGETQGVYAFHPGEGNTNTYYGPTNGAYQGDLRLTANFQTQQIEESSSVTLQDHDGSHFNAGLRFDPITLNGTGRFSGSGVRVSHSNWGGAQADGSWGGQFSASRSTPRTVFEPGTTRQQQV